MATLTFGQIYDAVRQELNDTEVSGGRIYTDTFQSRFLYKSYAKLFQEMHKYGLPGGTRTVYIYLPPRTSVIVPRNWSIPNFGTPDAMWSRPVLGSSQINLGIAPYYDSSSGFLVLTVNDSSFLSNGDTLEVIAEKRCAGDVNGGWTVDKGLNNAITLNGCMSEIISPVPTVTAGWLVKGQTDWVPMDPITEWMNLSPGVLVPAIDAWFYQSGVITVPPCSVAQELKITFKLSGTIVTSDPDSILGIDDAGTFLIDHIAGQCAASKGAPAKSKQYMEQAVVDLDDFITDRSKSLQGNIYESAWLREFTWADDSAPKGRRWYSTGAIGTPATSAGSGSGGGTMASVQIPVGVMDGVNATYTLTSVTGYHVIQLVWNGTTLEQGVGYTLSGVTITMLAGYIPNLGDTLEAYLYV